MPIAETLGLDTDGDDVELIRAIERSFGVRFDQEPRGWRTLGDIQATLEARLTVGELGLCATTMAFLRLRRVLTQAAGVEGRIGPGTPLKGLCRLPPQTLRALVARELGLSVPDAAASVWGCVGGVAVFVGLFGAIAVTVPQAWPLLLLIPLGTAMMAIDPGVHGHRTVGDLARHIAADNYAHFAALGADRRPSAIWQALRDLAAGLAQMERGVLGPETRLLA